MKEYKWTMRENWKDVVGGIVGLIALGVMGVLIIKLFIMLFT